MISSFLFGIMGVALTHWLGARYFGFDAGATAMATLASNLSGFVSLLLTLFLERRVPIRRVLMGNALKTWLVLGFLYTGLMAVLDPALRDPATMACLWLPLIFCTGWMLSLWGKAQDAIIGWEYRRGQKGRSARNDQCAPPKRDALRIQS